MKRAILGLALIAVLAWLGLQVWHRRPAPDAPATSGVDSTVAGVKAVVLFFGSANGDSLVSEAREMVEPPSLHERVATLVAELDRGPRGKGVAVLPAGTSVLHVYMDDRGLMTLDLSGAFRQRFRGGSTAEYLALASLMRTLGANLPEVRSVRIVCAGGPIATLGGHLPLDRPLEVSDWL